tara:strand:- start:2102 stop:2338 length:237 start_codon:yes stop_codon:yes gene_type:complete
MMNWNSPEERLALVERVGVKEYNKQHRQNMEWSVLETINGHSIRQVATRFGRLFSVGATGKAFQTFEAARLFAEAESS